MMIEIPCAPPSINRKPSQKFLSYFHDLTFPDGDLRIDINVFATKRSGDVDNRIKPVLNALEACGLNQSRVAYITARFFVAEKERTHIIIGKL